jgi:hypothetical protein
MNRTEKANELIERAKKLGVRVEIDSSPLNDGPKSEQPRKGIFERFRRSGAGSSVERDRS